MITNDSMNILLYRNCFFMGKFSLFHSISFWTFPVMLSIGQICFLHYVFSLLIKHTAAACA